ncbi:MAG TPA: sulfite exporter TauE/SafE family protein [Methanoregulaceae archaeon]|nr:sulfite exporter TauE/SafE family protein [Methanoregulaceae archaeon]
MDAVFLYSGLLLLTGAVVGLASGFFGVGGGFLMVPVQFWTLGLLGVEPGMALRTAFGTSLAVVLPTAASGTWAHHRRSAIRWETACWMGPSAAAFSFIGGMISTRLPPRPLELLLGMVLIAMAVRLARRPDCSIEGAPIALSHAHYLLLGVPIGLLSGLLGIGGGVVLVPVFLLLLHYPVHTAVGTSMPVILAASVGGVTSYILNVPPGGHMLALSAGYVHLTGFLALSASSIPMAQVGARFAHACPPRPLQLAFAGVMLAFGLLMIVPPGVIGP